MISVRTLVLASGLGALGALDAAALSFDHQPPLNRIVAEATTAFRGTVEAIDYGAATVSEGQSIPYETIRMRVGEDFGGAGAAQITLRQLGGRLPGEQTKFLVIPGLAELAPGDTVYVFNNDQVQPFFATLYGDASLFRIATDDTGSLRVLNAFWQPLLAGGGALWPEPGLRCLPVAEDRSRCVRTEIHVHDVSDEADVAPRNGRPVTPAMFDRFVRRWRDPDAPQGQTVSADDAAFAAALAAFGRQVSAGSAED